MRNLLSTRNYIVIKDYKELQSAKSCDLCRFIIMEDKNAIFIWTKCHGKWLKETFVAFGEYKEHDFETTGRKAYQSFYYNCGKEKVDAMKEILRPIEIWESEEQLHYYNFEYANTKIYKNIYVFDANSAFTYGVMQLPKGFEPLKEYMLTLYEKKEQSTNAITRSKYKNLQNYLIGYFARIKGFVAVRSKVISESNKNILLKMAEINKNKGTVFLSNTDSIVTDEIGNSVMQKYLGKEVGAFKLENKVKRLYYKSSNAYQLGDKITYSGVGYYSRKHTDFFKEQSAIQKGSLIEAFDFILEPSSKDYLKLCRVRFGQIEVSIINSIGEEIRKEYYMLGE